MAQENSTPIDTPTPEIAAWHRRWKKNRAFADGEDAVKAMGEVFLPRVRCDDSDDEYQAHLQRTGLYPAVNKIAQGLIGMILRKQPVLNTSSARIQHLASTMITPRGQPLTEFVEWVVRETMITDFVGVLADHPNKEQFTGLNGDNADRLGFRPGLSGYTAESILEVTTTMVGAAVKLGRVRLLENDGNRVRELILNDGGLYEVLVHDRSNGAFGEPERYIPIIDGQALTEIPFLIVNTQNKLHPTPSLLAPCVDLNLQHYVLSGIHSAMMHMTSNPIAVVTGYVPEIDPATNQPKAVTWDISPGAIWEFQDSGVKVEWFTFDPKGATLIENALRDKKDELSTIGHSILTPEKAAPEAAETQMIRRAAENATLAGFANNVSAKIQKSLTFLAPWADKNAGEISYKLNTDYMPVRMDAQTLTAWLAQFEAGAISWETYFYGLRDGGLVDPTLTPNQEEAKIAADRLKVQLLVAKAQEAQSQATAA